MVADPDLPGGGKSEITNFEITIGGVPAAASPVPRRVVAEMAIHHEALIPSPEGECLRRVASDRRQVGRLGR